MDAQEAGKDGLAGKPPPNTDGTPNETLGNQVTRLRQLISLLETFLSGDDILLIFPDGTSPALLSALIAGIPLNRTHEMEYQPGQVQFDVNYHSARAAWAPTPEYQQAISRGKTQLETLRQTAQQLHHSEVSAQAAKEAKRQAAMDEWHEARKDALQEARAKAMDKEAANKAVREPASAQELLGVTGAMGVAMAALALGDNPAAEKIQAVAANVTAASNDVGTNVTAGTIGAGSISEYPELLQLEDLVETSPIEIPEMAKEEEAADSDDDILPWSHREEMEQIIADAAANAEPDPGPSVLSAEEREQAALDYMNDVEGGDAFYSALLEMANEDD